MINRYIKQSLPRSEFRNILISINVIIDMQSMFRIMAIDVAIRIQLSYPNPYIPRTQQD